jgi:hypothetical protein
MRLPEVAMPGRGWLRTGGRPIGGLTARGLTVTVGVTLGGVVLLVVALVGGAGSVGVAPAPEPEAAPERIGPQTGVQPELRGALLTDEDLPDDAGPAPATPGVPPAISAPDSPPPPPPPLARGEEPSAADEACQALIEDPDELPAIWSDATPRETTAGRTTRRGGAVLHHVLSVFEDDDATAAYGQLRESATACDEFTATLDGSPVTVLLRRMATDRRESGDRRESTHRRESSHRRDTHRRKFTHRRESSHRRESTPRREAAAAGPDDTYTIGMTVVGPAETLTGWLTIDRVGPVVSVLRHLGPEDAPAGDPDRTRRSALDKLRPLLHSLDRGRAEAP